MKWDCNPKQRFTRNHLEKCYNHGHVSKMGVKRRPQREPYWNFWRAVFAGWLIRYPLQIVKGVGMFVLFVVFLIVFSFSSVEDTPSIEYNTNVPSVSE